MSCGLLFLTLFGNDTSVSLVGKGFWKLGEMKFLSLVSMFYVQLMYF